MAMSHENATLVFDLDQIYYLNSHKPASKSIYIISWAFKGNSLSS
jgi:hypothetical protein